VSEEQKVHVVRMAPRGHPARAVVTPLFPVHAVLWVQWVNEGRWVPPAQRDNPALAGHGGFAVGLVLRAWNVRPGSTPKGSPSP
jgi:hypothetical protein